MPLDFSLSDAQKQAREGARTFATQVLSTAHATYSHLPTQAARYQAIRPFYRVGVQAGLLKSFVPIPLGGTNSSFLDAAIGLEEMYAADPSVVLTIASSGLGMMPVIFSGDGALQRECLRPFLEAGEEGEPLASMVHSEPSGTANWLVKGGTGLQTTAWKDGDEWVVNGEKLWATNSAGWDNKGADLQSLVCRIIPSATSTAQPPTANPADSILILCVTRSIIAANGPSAYTVLAEPELTGHPATSGPHTRYTSFRVPVTQVLATGPAAAALIEQSFTATAALVGVFATSLMRAAFDAALKFAKTDARGGEKAIIYHQAVADLLMDVKMRTDTARLLAWKALWTLENGPGGFEARKELCLEAKVFGSDTAVRAVGDAMRVVGMSSYSKDLPFARLMNDAMVLPLFDGGNIGIRRRQFEKILQLEDYDSLWGF